MDFYDPARTNAIVLLCIIQCTLGVAISFLYLFRELKALWTQFAPVEPDIQRTRGCREEEIPTTSLTGALTIPLKNLKTPLQNAAVLPVCNYADALDAICNVFTQTDDRCSKKIVLSSKSSPKMFA